MSGAPLSSAEQSFFAALQLGFEKKADADIQQRDKLAPNTRLLLGIPEEGVRDLSEIEDHATQIEDVDNDGMEEIFGIPSDEIHGDVPPEYGYETNSTEASPPAIDMPEDDDVEQLAYQELVDENFINEEMPPPMQGPMPRPEPPGREFGGLFCRRQAHPIVIAEVLRERYKDGWVKWEPETLWWAIRKDFGPIGELAKNKIMALRVALQTGYPWTDWDIFENCGTAWNDHIPIFGAYQQLPPSEAAFTVQLLRELHPDFEFENEVAAYLGAVCEGNGYVFAPDEWFPGVQALIDRKKWIFSLRDDVAKTWEKVKDLSTEDIHGIDFRSNNPLDIHIGRLIAVREYLAAREGGRTQSAPQVAGVATPEAPVPVA